MAFCPGCGYEFREGMRRCPDCDLDLVANLEEVDTAQTTRIRGKTVSVFRGTGAAAEWLADMLDLEGLTGVVRPAPPDDGGAAGTMELHMLQTDAAANADLLKELLAEIETQVSQA